MQLVPRVTSRKVSISTSTPAVELSRPLHTTVFRSSQMIIYLESHSIRRVEQEDSKLIRTLPVYGDLDRVDSKVVKGKVALDPSCIQSGRLSIQIEGSFIYLSPDTDTPNTTSGRRYSGKRKYILFSSSITIPVQSIESNATRLTLGESLSISRRRPSVPSILSDTSLRSFPFCFELPNGSKLGEEMPHSFSSTTVVETSPRERASVESAQIKYSISATWEANDGSEEKSTLEAPFLFQPDPDFQSFDGRNIQPQSWLEYPLQSDRPMPFHCAITLPNPCTFNRTMSVPYFVVFTTSSKSPVLMREIASDATVSVSLIREVLANTAHRPPPTPPSSPSDSTDDVLSAARQRFLNMKRVARSASPILRRARSGEVNQQHVWKDKPLPGLPLPSELPPLSETRILRTNMSIGFPKRPRHRSNSETHPTLEAQSALPDGLIKDTLRLSEDLLPSINWPGIGVKYFLEVSVLFQQDNLQTRIPIRLV